jgi:hypothetical protein
MLFILRRCYLISLQRKHKIEIKSVLTYVLTLVCIHAILNNMSKVKRITANLPYKLLKDAKSVTHKGITETLILGLMMVKRSLAYQKAQNLKGKLKLKVDLDISRERNSR